MIDYSQLGIPKTVHGRTRREDKQARVSAATAAERACYLAVNARDGHRCRVCQRAVGGIGLLDRVIHHHLIFRSQGGAHDSANVLTICPSCDEAVHRSGKLQLAGDADQQDERGRLNGVSVSRLHEAGWKVDRWV